MNGVIGEILPSALGVAISPIPIIAAILMLLSPKARGTSVGFMLGWLLGIIVALVVFTLLSAMIPASDPTASKPIAGIDQDHPRAAACSCWRGTSGASGRVAGETPAAARRGCRRSTP